MAERNAAIVVEAIESAKLSEEEIRVYMLSGVSNWVDWLAQPWTWLLFCVPVDGIVAAGVLRASTRTPRGAARLGGPESGSGNSWDGGSGSRGTFCATGRSGPTADRALPGGLTVLACRPKPDWNKLVTIEIRERFYRVLRTEERQDWQW